MRRLIRKVAGGCGGGQLRNGIDVLVRLADGYSDQQGALMVDKLRAATDMSIELRRSESSVLRWALNFVTMVASPC